MVKEILKDSTYTGSFYSETLAGTKRFHWPSELPLISVDNPSDGDHLFKTADGLYTALEGTGRVYKIELHNGEEKIRFIRQDSTAFLGYNFGAKVFYFSDTLYSLGGYGLWNFTWHLRYFRPQTHGWEVIPINEAIQIINHPGMNFVDKYSNSFYLIREQYFNEGLKSGNKDLRGPEKNQKLLPVYRLDLITKDWENTGILNPEAQKIFSFYSFISDTPWGNLHCGGDRVKNKCYLINFNSNRVYLLKDKNLSSVIRDAALAGKNNTNPPERRVSYFHQDSLKFLNSAKQKFSFRLTFDDFSKTPVKIIEEEPLEAKIFQFMEGRSILIIGVLAFCTGFIFFMRAKKQINEFRDRENFDKQEIQVLRNLAQRPDMSVKPDEFDEILGIEGRTPEALKKRRSLMVRSINSKFTELYDEEEDLIKTERLESDRRMVRYTLNQKKLARISKYLKE